MGLLDKLKGLLKPLPGQGAADRGEDIDPRLDPENTMGDAGSTRPNPSLEEDVRPPAE